MRMRRECDANATRMRCECDANVMRMLCECDANAMRMRRECEPHTSLIAVSRYLCFWYFGRRADQADFGGAFRSLAIQVSGRFGGTPGEGKMVQNNGKMCVFASKTMGKCVFLLLECIWERVCSSMVRLSPSWSILEPTWGRFGAILGSSWGHSGQPKGAAPRKRVRAEAPGGF